MNDKDKRRQAHNAIPPAPPGIVVEELPAPPKELQPASSPQTELIPVRRMPDANGMVSAQEGGLVAAWNQAAGDWQASFSDTSVEGFNLKMRCKNRSDYHLQDCVAKPLDVTDWMLHRCQLINEEDGEQYDALRLVLVTSDGKTVSTCSEPFIERWGDVISHYGKSTFRPALRITVAAFPGKRKGKYLLLDSAVPVAT
jgi:hypothetical protein